MSLAAPYQEHYYVADGVTTSFAFGEDFTALSAANVKCVIYFEDGTNCVPTFTVDMTTGFITIVTLTKPDGTVLTVPPAGSIVRVFRDTPEQQNVTASQLQNYTAKQLERIFDSVVAMIQEVSYSDLHKTIRLTETQRDVSMEQLKEENDQAILYWDFETRQLKATDYGQNQVVKSDTVDRLVYLQPEGKIYFIPKGSNNPIAIGSATIHNDLGGRNAPDCHPESAITNLTTHLQELRDMDSEINAKAEEALNTANQAYEKAEGAEEVAGAAYEKAVETERVVQTFDERITEAQENASEAKEKATDAKTTVDNHVLNYNNPHQVTASQVGLGNVDNTSDLDKPISTATQAVLTAQQEEIDALSGRGRFLSTWNCATGLAGTNPPESPYTYKSGDYFIVGVVSSADPAVNYKPDGSSYTTGVASTVVETGNVGVDDVYLYDGTNWLLQINTQKTVTFSAVAGDIYDNASATTALNAKADGTNTINGAALSNSETFFYGTSATAGLTADKKVSIPSITTLKKGVVIFVKPDMTATTGGITLKLNDFTAYPVRYNGANISSTTDSIVWNQSYVSIFVFDGTYWQFAGHGYDKDTTYSDATDSVKGIAKLYNSTGNNTDGSMTQKAITDALPTVNDATLTIQKNGTDVATFTANASSNVTANISVPTTAGDVGAVAANASITGATHTKITYDSKGLVTGGSDITLSDVTDITATAAEVNVLDGITASTTEINYVGGVTSSIQTQIDGKQAKSSSAYNMGNSTGGWTAMSTAQQNALNSGATTTNIGQIATNTTNIANEIIDRQDADNGLQSQIDAIVAKSDVVDIVGTYAELQAYDTSGLGNNDVVKVISDSTHNNAPSYYRWVITGGVGAWVYIGSEAETYTKAETDALLNNKQDVLTAGSNITISGSTISATDTTYTGSDGITLTGTNFTNSGVRSVSTGSTNGTISVNTNGTSADVAVYGLGSAAYTASTDYATSAQGGLADTAVQPGDLATVATTGDYDDLLNKPTIPTVNDATLTIQKNGTNVATFTANASSAVTANISVPTDTNDLTNGAGYITGITSGDVTTALGYTPYSDANPNGYTNNVGTVTSVNNTSPDGSGNVSLTIPTVNNATITITQGGVTKGSFTLNQASGDTIALDAGGGGSYTAGNGIDITSNVISVDDLDCGTMS